MRRVLTELDVGALAEGGKPDSLADAILKVLRLSDEEWTAQSRKGIEGVDREYSWAQDAYRFQEAVDEVLGVAEAAEA